MNNLKKAMKNVLPSDSYIRQYIDFDLYNLSLEYYQKEQLNKQLAEKFPNILFEDDGTFRNVHPVLESFRQLDTILAEIASILTGFTHSSYVLDDSNIFTFAQYTNSPDAVLETCDSSSFCRHTYYDEVKEVFKQRLDGFVAVDIKKIDSFKLLIEKLEQVYNSKIDVDLFESSFKNSLFITNLLKVSTTKYSG
jgi:hypothetical protein